MKFSEEVLQNCNKEFLNKMESYAAKALEKCNAIFYTDLRDYGHGVIPSGLVILMPVEDEELYELLDPILEEYSKSDNEEDVSSYLLILPEPATELEVFCQR